MKIERGNVNIELSEKDLNLLKDCYNLIHEICKCMPEYEIEYEVETHLAIFDGKRIDDAERILSYLKQANKVVIRER